MRYLIATLLFIVLISFNSHAQEKLPIGHFEARITLKDKTTHEGVIIEDSFSPELYQEKITFIPKENYTPIKNKKARIEYKASDILSASFDNRNFETTTILDQTGTIPKNLTFLLEKAGEGNLSLYKRLVKDHSEKNTRTIDEKINNPTAYRNKSKPVYYLAKNGESKAKLATTKNIESYISDNPSLLEDYKSGKFTRGDTVKSAKINKLINSVSKVAGDADSSVDIEALIKAYNQ